MSNMACLNGMHSACGMDFEFQIVPCFLTAPPVCLVFLLLLFSLHFERNKEMGRKIYLFMLFIIFLPHRVSSGK